MRAWGIAAIAGVLGCSFNPAGSAGDDPGIDAAEDEIDAAQAVIDAALAIDADPDAPDATGNGDCDFAAAIGSLPAPIQLAELNSPDLERDPSLTQDALTIFFSSNRQGGTGNSDFWTATRPDRQSSFGVPTPVAALNTPDEETRLSVTPDGLTAYFGTRGRGGLGGVDVFVATRSSVGDPFSGVAAVAGVNTADDDHDPHISADELSLYLAPNNPSGGQGAQEIAISVRANTGEQFPALTLATSVNSSDTDADPATSSDELLLILTSNRAGGPGNGDLWFATRALPSDSFGAPQLLNGANSSDQDGDAFLTSDGCELYFFSNRAGGTGNQDLYVIRL